MIDGNGLDKLLMRIKDMLLIGGTVFGVFVFIFRFQTLPDSVAEHTLKLNELNGNDTQQTMEIRDVNKDIEYIKDTLSEIKGLLKNR